ncbi:MAG: hypothetical protein K6A43_08190 [Treponema sp.]|nr:hypothetical protein [Treponema sp.]
MLLFNKKILILITLSALTLNLFAESLPNGYKDVKLGMSLQETKETLVKDPDFGYHGDRDVSLIPNSSKTLIETDAQRGLGSNFLTQCWFQFYFDELYIITINVNPEKMDYYSIFTKLTEKYGEPTNFSPQAATWKDDEVTMSLEKPLTLKYIDNKIFEQTQNYSNIQASPTEVTREMFLDGL